MPTIKERIEARAVKLRKAFKFRAAIDLDIMQLLNIATEYAAEAERWSDLRFDKDRLVKCLVFAIKDKDQQIFIATLRGKIVGAVWAGIDKVVWSSDKICYDLFVYVHTKHRGLSLAIGLVQMMEDWGRACGAKVIHTGANSGIFKDKPASALYEYLDYDTGGLNFYKTL